MKSQLNLRPNTLLSIANGLKKKIKSIFYEKFI